MSDSLKLKENTNFSVSDVPTEKIGVNGIVEYWISDEFGNEIEGTRQKGTNLIYDALKYNLASAIVSASNSDFIDVTSNSFTDKLNSDVPASTSGKYGFALYSLGDYVVTGLFNTSISSGGDGSSNYVEFYGYLTAYVDGSGQAFTISSIGDRLYLAKDISDRDGAAAETALGTIYASYNFLQNVTVEANRRFHFYWRINL